MRTPDLISDLFDYQKVTITPGRGHGADRTRNQNYVQLPRILNISTERKTMMIIFTNSQSFSIE